MTEFDLVINVFALFFIRIGIPLLLLVLLGTVIDNRQRKQHQKEVKRQDKHQS